MIRLLFAFSVLSLLAVGAGCARKQAAASRSFPAVAVRTEVLEPVPIPDASEYLATLKSRRSTALNPQVEGQITAIFVKSGDRVKAGTPLVQIDPLMQEALVASQEAARAGQVANARYAQIQWERAQKLYASGVMSKQDYDQARTTFEAAQQQLKSMGAQLQQQQVQLHYYRVVAPTAGIIGDIPVHVGDRVTTSTLLTTVDEPGNLELYVNVPLDRAKDLRLGQTVQLLDGEGNVEAVTRIDFISPEVDNNTQSVLVKAAVKNSSGTLRTSQFTEVRIIWGTHRGLLIPVLAVSRVGGQYFAFVVEGNGRSMVARQKLVHLGPISGNQYEVLDGLRAGDRVAVEGVQELADGVPVTETSNDSGGKPSR